MSFRKLINGITVGLLANLIERLSEQICNENAIQFICLFVGVQLFNRSGDKPLVKTHFL